MAGRTNRLAVDWDVVAGPILATPPWRPGTSWPPHAMAGAAADPRKHDWAGPGFTRPGPVPDTGPYIRCAPGNAKPPAGMTTLSDDPARSLTGEAMRPAAQSAGSKVEGELHDRQHQ
jgi:hypothetical protein